LDRPERKGGERRTSYAIKNQKVNEDPDRCQIEGEREVREEIKLALNPIGTNTKERSSRDLRAKVRETRLAGIEGEFDESVPAG